MPDRLSGLGPRQVKAKSLCRQTEAGMRSVILVLVLLLVPAPPAAAGIRIGVLQLQDGIPHYSINVETFGVVHVIVAVESAIDGMTGFAFSNPIPDSQDFVTMGGSNSPCLGLDCDVGPGGYGDWLVGLGSCLVLPAGSYYWMVRYDIIFFAPTTLELCVAAPSVSQLDPPAPEYATCESWEVLPFELAPRPTPIPPSCLQVHAGTVPTAQLSWSGVKALW